MEPSPLSAHRLRPGLPGYLIPFAPLAFARSVRSCPVSRFRLRRSSRYLRISPLYLEFHSPLQPSSQVVSGAVPRLSRGISHRTHLTACVPFKPSDSEQRSPPPSYRGCWHGVSRGFLRGLGQERMMLALSPILPPNRSLQPEGLHPPRGVAASDFRPLCKILDCSLP